MVNDFLLFIPRFMNFINMLGCRRVASPCSRHKFLRGIKIYSIQKYVWSDLEENGVVSYLLPLLVSAGIMHFARRIVKPLADGG